MTKENDPLDEIARALARIETVVNSNSRKLGDVEHALGELKLTTAEVKRDAGRVLLRLGDLETAVDSEQQFTSSLYDNHEKRIKTLETKAT